MIADALTPLVVPIDSVKLHPDNPRRGKLAAISKSLERFGQQRPIVVQQSSGYIIGGNHVWRAAKQLGWTEIAAHVTDVDDMTAKALLVALNRTADLSNYDEPAVLAMLENLGSLDGTGYSTDDVDDLIARVQGMDAQPRGEAATSMREVVLTMGESAHAAYLARLEKLKALYGTDTAAATIYEAIKREYQASQTADGS